MKTYTNTPKTALALIFFTSGLTAKCTAVAGLPSKMATEWIRTPHVTHYMKRFTKYNKNPVLMC